MDLRQYVQAVRKFWWVILIPMLFGTLFGAFQVSRAVPQHRASVTFFVKTSGDATLSALSQGEQLAQRRVNSYVELLSSDRLAEAVVNNSDLDLTPGQVSGMLGASGNVNTVLLTASATSTSRDIALLVAEAVSVEFVKLVDDVENGDGENRSSSVTLEVVDGPSVKKVPAKSIMVIGLRAAIGLALGLALALVLELRDTSVRSDDEILELGLGPILGRVPFDRRARTAPLVLAGDTSSVRAEYLRQLRTNLQFIDVDNPAQVLIVTSSVAEEGKSLTAANLALTMVQADRRVLVVEADFRRPQLADYFDVERSVGLTDVIAGRAALDDVLQPWGTGGLVVLPSGHLPPNPSELLGSHAMEEIITTLREHFDLIVIDTPPLVPVTDAAVASTWADGVLQVVRYGRTTRQQLAHARRALHAVDAHLLGTVLTMVPMSRSSSYASYHSYQTVEQAPPERVWGADAAPPVSAPTPPPPPTAAPEHVAASEHVAPPEPAHLHDLESEIPAAEDADLAAPIRPPGDLAEPLAQVRRRTRDRLR